MVNPGDIEARMRRMEDIEAIKRLKYKYLRCLDLKLWDELAECFAPDATTTYHDGEFQPKGVYAIMRFIQRGMARYQFFGVHHCHSPEIDLTGDTSAKGMWALFNYMIDSQENEGLLIGAFYNDEYIKTDGQWKIKSTGYTRIFEERWKRGDAASLRLTANMFASATGPA